MTLKTRKPRKPRTPKVIKIEKGVPLPYALSYPIADMVVGDSFAVPVNGNVEKIRGRITSAITTFKKRTKSKAVFTVRKTGKTSLRVWRVA